MNECVRFFGVQGRVKCSALCSGVRPYCPPRGGYVRALTSLFHDNKCTVIHQYVQVCALPGLAPTFRHDLVNNPAWSHSPLLGRARQAHCHIKTFLLAAYTFIPEDADSQICRDHSIHVRGHRGVGSGGQEIIFMGNNKRYGCIRCCSCTVVCTVVLSPPVNPVRLCNVPVQCWLYL